MQPLLLTDYETIKPYLDLADYEGYNSNFVTMMMWNHEYHLEYEIHEHFLIMLHHFNGVRYFSMPYTSKEYYQEAMDYMIQYSKLHRFPFMIDCAISSVVEDLKEIYGDRLIFQRTRDFDDYVYDRDMLQNLTGKKMQKRRNHYNYFKKTYPDYEYKPLSIDRDFALILECLSKWERDKEATMSLTSEVYGILYLLSSKHLLDIKLGGIFINNQLKAFIIGSPLKHETIQIHVEKADGRIRGLYPAILKEFLDHEFPGYKYINREEDMGLENLRTSKMRLHPCHMVEKSRIWLNDSCIRPAKASDLEDIKRLWLDRFEDEDDVSATFYFNHKYRPEYTYVTEFQHRVIAAMSIEPFCTSEDEEAYFILGVSTAKEYEHQGLMKRMMTHVLDIYQGKRIYLQAYHPEIYTRFGFRPSHLMASCVIDKRKYRDETQLVLSDDVKDLAISYNKYVSAFKGYFPRDDTYYQEFYMPRCAAFHEEVRTFKDGEKTVGYMTYHQDEQEVFISELIYETAYLDDICRLLTKHFSQKITVQVDVKAHIACKKRDVKTHMMCIEDVPGVIENRYINEVY